MKANELRIGNWVLIPYNKSNKEEGFFEATISQIGEFGAYVKPEDYEPIPLTEHWMFKFGFYETTKEHYVSGLYTLNNPDGFYINKETMCYCDIDYEGTTNDRIKIQYVHQLQNLYFALTGEELTYKGGEQ
jgi:hypothetical protein